MSAFDSLVSRTLPWIPKAIVGKVASRYIAGETLDDAMRTVRLLNSRGFRATVDVLGEFVADRDEARRNTVKYHELMDAIESEKLDSGVSIKLTAVGLSIEKQFVRGNFAELLRVSAQKKIFVRIDMEDSPYTSETLAIYEENRAGNRLGVVVQAYLHRTESDVRRLIESGESNFRLCKGIYIEPETIAFKDREQIRQNFLTILDIMLESGTFVGIATHDEYLVAEAEKRIRERRVSKDRYEFQMLLGVLPELRDSIQSRGHTVRIYVPFGEAWYGYSTRRLKENPKIAGYVFKSLFSSR